MSLAQADIQIPTRHRFSIAQYHALGDTGAFAGQRVQLIRGEIIDMPPKAELHAFVTGRLYRALLGIFTDGYLVRNQDPLRLLGHSEPEPDVAVVCGADRDFVETGPPTSAVLVVEVSLSTLAYDRDEKLKLYAEAGFPEYWIANPAACEIEVYTQPRTNDGEWGYETVVRYGINDQLSVRNATLTVAAVFP